MIRRAVITGAFSFTGAAVARELSHRGWTIHTLTNRRPPPGTDHITSSPLSFDPAYLEKTFAHADVFVNTYWVRLPWDGQSFETAINHSKILIDAASQAGVRRFVHVSVSNARSNSNLGYYHGKAEVEAALQSSNLSYAIVCPTLIVGPTDVLTNNIAWFLRRFPFFLVSNGGGYRLQPITLADTARIVADQAESLGITRVDAAGPEVMTFTDYVRTVAKACRVTRPIIGVPRPVALAALGLVQRILRDVVLTKEELLGLEQEGLLSREAPLGKESVVDWLMANGGSLGRQYANDLQRHFREGSRAPVLNPIHPL